MTPLRIELHENRGAWFPGETLRGTAFWQLGAPPASAELRLFWFTDGKGTQDVMIVESLPFHNPAAQGEEAFQFQLPLEPYSFHGSLIRLTWALELIVDGDSTRREFSLSHTGDVIRLESP